MGALSYVSLKVKPGQGKAAFRSAIAGMMTVVGPRRPPETADDGTSDDGTSDDGTSDDRAPEQGGDNLEAAERAQAEEQ